MLHLVLQATFSLPNIACSCGSSRWSPIPVTKASLILHKIFVISQGHSLLKIKFFLSSFLNKLRAGMYMAIEYTSGPPTFWTPGTASVEKGFFVDQKGCGFVCCLHSVDGVLLVCTDQLLACCGPLPVHRLGVGDFCNRLCKIKYKIILGHKLQITCKWMHTPKLQSSASCAISVSQGLQCSCESYFESSGTFALVK